jgi:hypothetical protein
LIAAGTAHAVGDIGAASVEPILRWALGEHGDVADRFTHCFEYSLEDLLPLGVVWEAGHADGAAVWVSPDADEAWQAAMMHDERTGTLTLDGGRHYAAGVNLCCFREIVAPVGSPHYRKEL